MALERWGHVGATPPPTPPAAQPGTGSPWGRARGGELLFGSLLLRGIPTTPRGEMRSLLFGSEQRHLRLGAFMVKGDPSPPKQREALTHPRELGR